MVSRQTCCVLISFFWQLFFSQCKSQVLSFGAINPDGLHCQKRSMFGFGLHWWQRSLILKGASRRRMILRIQSWFLLQMQDRNQISLPKNNWNNYIGQAHLFSNPFSSPNLDQTNNFLTTLNVTSRNSNLWIIDSREFFFLFFFW